jgi:trehalose-phosphatase
MYRPHWAEIWPEISRRLEGRERILIALDLDGTLAPITEWPRDARIPEETRILLRKLSLLPLVTVAVVSGRALADVRERVGLDRLTYCGNHGFEIEGPEFVWRSAEARAHRPSLARAVAQLRLETAVMPGVIVEDKGLTASVHWRMASNEDRQVLGPLVIAAVERNPGLRITHGKAVWELRPQVSGSKGTAVCHLLERAGMVPADAIFLGDDETDESAFRELRDGVTLRVGDSITTAAQFHARDVVDIAGFLLWLFVSLSGRPAGARLSATTTFPKATAA